MSRQLLASDLYARAHSVKNEGEDECHWCGAPCRRFYIHDDVQQIPFTRSRSTARRPANSYICQGCWHWRRRRVTVNFLGGDFLDLQTAADHSWWVTERGAYAVRSGDDFGLLYDLLLKPPLRFLLSLVEGSTRNELQLAVCNDVPEILADTRLTYTLNNIPHVYTIYELEQALLGGVQGKEPGVQALIRFLGPLSSPNKEEVIQPKRDRGRPPPLDDGRVTKKVIRK